MIKKLGLYGAIAGLLCLYMGCGPKTELPVRSELRPQNATFYRSGVTTAREPNGKSRPAMGYYAMDRTDSNGFPKETDIIFVIPGGECKDSTGRISMIYSPKNGTTIQMPTFTRIYNVEGRPENGQGTNQTVIKRGSPEHVEMIGACIEYSKSAPVDLKR